MLLRLASKDSGILGRNCCTRSSLLEDSLNVITNFWFSLCPSF